MKNFEKKGYIHIYTGNGKGKTTAALGLAIRASGHGMKTYIGQFMKGQAYGELAALKNNSNIFIEQYGDKKCIHKADVTQKHIAQAVNGLEKAYNAMLSGNYQIIILDEINVALWFDLLKTQEVLTFLDKRPIHTEVVLTGRNAPNELIEVADLVSDIREVKHYYNQGIQARDGIER